MQQPPRREDALDYLERVRDRFDSEPDVYSTFLDIMKLFKENECVAACAVVVWPGPSVLFQGL